MNLDCGTENGGEKIIFLNCESAIELPNDYWFPTIVIFKILINSILSLLIII